MSDWSAAGVRPIHRAAPETANPGRERIVFLASRQVVYQCLSQAAQRHFSVFEVSLVDQFSVVDVPDDAVRLVLLGYGQGWISANSVSECRRRFPAAAIGVVVEHGAQDVDHALIEQHLIQGVLPLTLPLDVWLAVVSLLVAGGEYLSEEFTGTIAHRREDAADRPSSPAMIMSRNHPVPLPPNPPPPTLSDPTQRFAGRVLHGVDQAAVLGIESLTARERQILQLVSEGYQNKLIADRMALSEHTVKAHVHNLIAKLRVTNRTQAAAAYLHDQDIAQAPRGDERADAGLVALHGR